MSVAPSVYKEELRVSQLLIDLIEVDCFGVFHQLCLGAILMMSALEGRGTQ